MIRDEEPGTGRDHYCQEPCHARAADIPHDLISNGMRQNVQCLMSPYEILTNCQLGKILPSENAQFFPRDAWLKFSFVTNVPKQN